jgi:hypothetical protein
LFPSSMGTVRAAEQRFHASTLADSLLEQQVALPFSQLLLGHTQLPDQAQDGITYHLMLDIVKPNNSENTDYLRALRITVTWSVRGLSRQIIREIWVHRLASQQL